ncbi:hypothetical protein [Rickettsia conorii]|uniref:hypothetical protein n=1 Tax=Rickettsia conorii TaxID=781 RepID=UPI000A87581C|nr:hypothetical protein [Rickettsia conorii]
MPRATVNPKLAHTLTNATAGKRLGAPTDSVKYNSAPTLSHGWHTLHYTSYCYYPGGTSTYWA